MQSLKNMTKIIHVSIVFQSSNYDTKKDQRKWLYFQNTNKIQYILHSNNPTI